MFNIYLRDKQLSKELETEQKAQSLEKLQARHKKKTEQLNRRQEERITAKLSELLESAPRAEMASTVTSMRGFLQSQGVHTGKERVEKAAEWNSWLDPCPPDHSAVELRPRLKNKELHPPFSTRPKTAKDQMRETILYQRQFLDTSCAPNSTSQPWYKDFKGRHKLSFKGGKEVNHYYHYKTHFKSIEHFAVKNSKKSKSVLDRLFVRSHLIDK